jgi:hypothetical protein
MADETSMTQVATDDGTAMSRNSPFISPFYQYGSSIQSMTNPKQLLEDLEYQFKGMKKSASGKWVVVGEPLMNDIGITRIMNVLYSSVNRITIMSNISKQELPVLMELVYSPIVEELMLNRKRFDIVNTTNCTTICDSAKFIAFVCIKRGYEEGDKRFWKGSISETRITQDKPGQNKGWLNSINPWAKG